MLPLDAGALDAGVLAAGASLRALRPATGVERPPVLADRLAGDTGADRRSGGATVREGRAADSRGAEIGAADSTRVGAAADVSGAASGVMTPSDSATAWPEAAGASADDGAETAMSAFAHDCPAAR